MEAVKTARALDERRQQVLKEILLEMANIETMVAAGQPHSLKKGDVLRLAGIVDELLTAARKHRRETAAA